MLCFRFFLFFLFLLINTCMVFVPFFSFSSSDIERWKEEEGHVNYN